MRARHPSHLLDNYKAHNCVSMAGQEDDLSELLSSLTASSATSAETDFASTTGVPSRVQNSAAENTNAASSSAAGGSGSSIQWGPAITASPLPSSEVNQDNDNNNNNNNNYSNADQESSGSGLSGNAKKVIICTTTIGMSENLRKVNNLLMLVRRDFHTCLAHIRAMSKTKRRFVF